MVVIALKILNFPLNWLKAQSKIWKCSQQAHFYCSMICFVRDIFFGVCAHRQLNLFNNNFPSWTWSRKNWATFLHIWLDKSMRWIWARLWLPPNHSTNWQKLPTKFFLVLKSHFELHEATLLATDKLVEHYYQPILVRKTRFCIEENT